MPGETQLVAIKAHNTGGPYGIKGFFAAGRLVTDGTNWKCSSTFAANWNTLTFDDSSWPAAKEITHPVNIDAFSGIPITGHGSKWIWAETGSTVYCRGFISKYQLQFLF